MTTEKHIKLKIVSDGTVNGTKITDQDGNHVTNVQALEIRWKLEANGRAKDYGAARATIECILTPCDISVVGDCYTPDLLKMEPKEALEHAREMVLSGPKSGQDDGR